MPLEKLKMGNKNFVATFIKNKDLYTGLVENGQHPKVLWVGCSDSRVVPEFIVNVDAGDLFVTRNIANIIPPTEANDHNTSSVLEYAVLHLNVEHIVICGHTGCGGINAALNGIAKDTRIHKWLQHTAPAIESAKTLNTDSKELTAIKENVKLQASNLLTFNYIKTKYEQNLINIHMWLYDMHTGKISFYFEEDNKWYQL